MDFLLRRWHRQVPICVRWILGKGLMCVSYPSGNIFSIDAGERKGRGEREYES